MPVRLQLSVIQFNCAVRILEALAALAAEYVNDKLVILTVRHAIVPACICNHCRHNARSI